MKTVALDYVPATVEHRFRLAPHHELLVNGPNASEWITGNVVGTALDVPVLLRADGDKADMVLLEELYGMAIDFPWSPSGLKRLGSGANYRGAAFGNVEARAIRRRMGTAGSAFSYQHPAFSEVMEALVKRAWMHVEDKCPDLYLAIDSAPKALPEWRIRDTPFTSGVINATVCLPYHRDRGNVQNTGSVMWISRRHATGGHLHIPELNVVVDCSHGALLVFYGELFWHGVTQMGGLSRKGAGRFSVVAYSKQGILKAKSPEEEHRIAAERGTAAGDDVRETVLKYE